LLGYSDPPLKVLGHTWSNEATARYFDVSMQPLSAEELKKKTPPARSGLLVQVTAKAGLPQGADPARPHSPDQRRGGGSDANVAHSRQRPR